MDILKRIDLLLEEKDIDIDKISKLIKRDCKKFLKESQKRPVYRGISERQFEFKKFKVRKDRKPTDMDISLHKDINTKFKELHGVKNIRSVSLFGTGSIEHVERYGEAYYIFPIGNYTYWWSPKVVDLHDKLYFKNIYNIDDIVPENKEWLNKLLKSYIDKDLPGAIKSGNEIMFLCDEYYAMDLNIYREVKDLILRKNRGA